MTNFHVLDEKYINENKELNLTLNYEKDAVSIDLEIERKTYCNEDYNRKMLVFLMDY